MQFNEHAEQRTQMKVGTQGRSSPRRGVSTWMRGLQFSHRRWGIYALKEPVEETGHFQKLETASEEMLSQGPWRGAAAWERSGSMEGEWHRRGAAAWDRQG